MPIELPKKENLMPFNIDELFPSVQNFCKDEDFVEAFLAAVPDRETQEKFLINSSNYFFKKAYDPKYVLFFRRTLPSNKPKHEERRTNIYNITRMGLKREIPPGPHRLHSIILCDSLEHITHNGEKKGNTDAFTDGEIVVNFPEYDQSTCILKVKPQHEKRELEEYLETQNAITQEEILKIIQSTINSSIGESSKSYKEYTKIKNCKNNLQKIFAKKIPKKQFISEASSTIISMLTDRESYNKMLKDNGGDLMKLKNNYKTQNDRYNKTLEATQKVVKENQMDRDSNPAWYGIETTPEIKKAGLSYKHYTTIPIQNYSYIAKIPNLANQLRKLGLENDDAISIKVPNNFICFLKHNDSIVIHFKNQKNSEKITKSILERSKLNNIQLGDRELSRTTLAADGKDDDGEKSSFSELVSKNIASWMYTMRQTKKYTEDVIIEQGILHAVQQSSKPPKINGK